MWKQNSISFYSEFAGKVWRTPGPGGAPVWQSLGPFPGPFRPPAEGPHRALNLGKFQTFLGRGRTLLEPVETLYGVWDIRGTFGGEVGSFRVQDPGKSHQFGFSNTFLLVVIICLDMFSLLWSFMSESQTLNKKNKANLLKLFN